MPAAQPMPPPPQPQPQLQAPLAPRTSLGLGGPAQAFCTFHDLSSLQAALTLAEAEAWPVTVLGGGSNVVIADAGLPGLVLHPVGDQLRIERSGDRARLRAHAGVRWDRVVQACVEAGLQGVEALSGIPGQLGAAPIQNIGAYGQELQGSLHQLWVWDRVEGRRLQLGREACGLSYRDSRFKRAPGRWIVLEVELELSVCAWARPAYAQLQARVGEQASLQELRAAVLALRAEKSMLADPEDPNARSAGSFFMNPILSEAEAAAVQARVDAPLPSHPAGPGRVKLSAAWLLEQAGFGRGWGEGRVGLSERHCLAVINRGGATTAELVAVAAQLRAGVAQRFGVQLRPEPVPLGFAAPPW